MRPARGKELSGCSTEACAARRKPPALRRWLPATLLWALIAAPSMRAQTPKHTDYEVKAAYLYNFGRFVEWPSTAATASDSFTICVLGQDPFGPALDTTLGGQRIGNKSVTAKRISGPQEASNCQILFMSSSEASRIDKIIQSIDKTAVLTVSDLPQFSQHGGMIQFVLEGNRVRFEVNLTATESARLTLSSELLRVATAVRKAAPRGD